MTPVQNKIARTFKRHLMATALTATGLVAMGSSALADNWTDHVADEAGGISIDTSIPNTTNIQQHLNQVTVRGDGDINAGWTVNVAQPSSSSKYILYDVENDPTEIMGTLKANGAIYIFDQNGVIFGKDSVVNVGSIIVGAGTIADGVITPDTSLEQDLANIAPTKEIELNGALTVAEAGVAGFVAESIKHTGFINAKLGTVVFASGKKLTLDLYGDNLFEIAAGDEVENALIDNKGKIKAEGGKVIMTAAAAKSAVDNVINMDGIVDVSSVTVKGGKIILGGGSTGTVKVSGTLNANGTSGGTVKVTGQNINVAETAVTSADALTNGDGGVVDMIAQDHMDYRGAISARGGSESGDGGTAEVSGYGALGYDGSVDLTAENGATGDLLLDPAFAVIHSGAYPNALGAGYVITAQSLANTMKTAQATLTATDFIDVGTRFGSYSTGIAFVDNILNSLIGTGTINLGTWTNGGTGATTNGLRLVANTINFNKDVIMGTSGVLSAQANTVNLNSTIFNRDGVTLLDDTRLDSTASTINVVSNEAKIQQALHFAQNTGTTVNVRAGTYNESLTISKSVILKGANAGKAGNNATRGLETVIDPNSPGVHVTADNVTVDGFTITATSGADGYGVWVDNADNTTITNNNINNTSEAAVFAQNANGLDISDNLIADTAMGWNKSGINISGGSAITIADNTLTNIGGQGIYAEGPFGGAVTQLDITGNTITNAQFNGISVNKWNGADIANNTISGTTSGHGVVVALTSNTKIRGNSISNMDGAGVDVYYGNFTTTIQSNTLSNNKYGVQVEFLPGSGNINTVVGSNSSAALGNTITGGTTGVLVNGGTNLVVGLNKISGQSDAGIDVKNSTGTFNSFFGNKLNNTGSDGIRILNTRNVTLNRNEVGLLGAIGGNGILVTTGNGATIINNTVGDAAINGIWIDQATGASTVRGNTVSGATNDGIHVTSDNVATTGNTVHDVGQNGINYIGYRNALISGNTVYNTGLMGIKALNTRIVDINNNLIYGTGDDGIHLTTLTGTVNVSDNTIGQTGSFVTGNGIYVRGTQAAQILRNTISNIKVVNQEVVDYNGIFLDRDRFSNVTGNTITGARDGVKIEGGSDNLVQNNRISDSVRVGVFASASDRTRILDNTISNSGLNSYGGITLFGGNSQTISGNTITDIPGTSGADAGIYVADVRGGTNRIDDNIITGVDGYGIFLKNSPDFFVTGNDVSGVTGMGIYGRTLANVTISDNDVGNTTDDGIHVIDSTGAIVIDNNRVGTSLASIGGDGIYVTNTNDTNAITNNVVANVKGTGILAVASRNLDVSGNDVSNGGGIGIKLDNVTNAGINDNDVSGTKDDAIQLINSRGVLTINDNVIGTALAKVEGNGIYVVNSGGVNILRNTIENILVVNQNLDDYNGIYLRGVNGAIVGSTGNANVITGARDGIKVARNSRNTIIQDNDVSDSVRMGIFSEASDATSVLDNTVLNSGLIGWGGITVQGGNAGHTITGNIVTDIATSRASAGIYLDTVRAGTNIIANNIVSGINGYGIIARNIPVAATVDITDNTVTNVDRSGIYLNSVKTGTVDGNEVTGSLENGLYVGSATNGNIIVSGNTFTDNTIGALFESGVIDFTVPSPNFFVGGTIGLRFAPVAGASLSLVDDDAPGVEVFNADPFFTPSNFGGTIGAQNFEGQSSYYVELANGAFFTPGTPTWLNGLNSTYDGFTPSALGPDFILPEATLDALNAKFFHYPNQNDLGVFFFGRLEDPALINQNLIFNRFGAFNGDATGLNIQIRGLPTIPGGGTAANLNDLTPFAGGPTTTVTTASAEDLNAIETAAGDETKKKNNGGTTTGVSAQDNVPNAVVAETLSTIETESGTQDQACWGNAVAIAGNGQIVNVVYGGSITDNLAQAASCGGSF